MKKLIWNVIATILMVIGLGGIATLSPAYAEATVTCADGTTAATFADCNDGASREYEPESLIGIVRTVINIVVGLVGVVSLALIIVGGVGYATAQNDASKRKSRDTIFFGVGGVALTVLAIVLIVCDVFGLLIGLQ